MDMSKLFEAALHLEQPWFISGVNCRISSYLQTMKNKGINPLIAVSWALNGKFNV